MGKALGPDLMARVRVLHIGKYYPPHPGGIENFLGDLLGAQRASGLDARALVHDSPGEGLKALCEGVTRVPCRREVLYVPVSPSFGRYLAHTMRAFSPDILHIHLPNVSAFWALAYPQARSRPWVVHWHADVVPSKIDRRLKVAYQLYRPLEQALLSHSARVIATSPPYLEKSEPLRRLRARCKVVPLGVDETRLETPSQDALCQAEDSWPPGALRVLAVGRLTYYKGFNVLIEAAARVSDLSVLIVGQGTQRRRLEKAVAKAGLSGRVSLRGSLPDRGLHALLSTCDTLVLPSLERTEAFGLVLLEAMRYGKPIVASDIPGSGVGWVVGRSQGGLLVAPGDPGAFGAALGRLLQDPGLRRALGQQGKAAFREAFRIDRVAREIGEIYAEVLKKGGQQK